MADLTFSGGAIGIRCTKYRIPLLAVTVLTAHQVETSNSLPGTSSSPMSESPSTCFGTGAGPGSP